MFTGIPAIAYAEPAKFSKGEVAILALLILVSLSLFWWRFSKVVRSIAGAKNDPGFSIHPIGRRLWDFFWNVVCQAKVIRQRPLPGIAHAFVFWGFCAFVLVSLNHFATAIGASFLQPGSAAGDFYLYFAGLFALLVAIAITGLFVRRFFVRPIWLGKKVSYESGFIAFLIFLLMVTYLAAFLVRDGGASATALWWVHTLALMTFLPLLPHTKHLHLLLSPATVFLSRDGFSRIPPLVGDDDFGLVAGKDVTKLVALQSYSCVECGRCTEHCPAANTGKELNPKEVILGLRAYLNEFGPSSEQPLIGKHNSLDAVFQCTTCGSCEFQCPVGIQHLPVIAGLRRGTVNTGVWEDSYGTKLFLALERNGNALGLSAAERDRFIQKQQLPTFDGSQEYCLWLGCMGAYDPRGREIVVSLARVMSHLGTTFGVLRKEKCTGDAARRLGNDLVFQQLAEQNLEMLEQSKVKKMISICPHCVRTISTDWKDFGSAPEIEHHSEFLARNRNKLPQRAGGPQIVFHDPCYLGRYRDIYDEPRQVLRRSGNVIEAPRHRERSFCCGAGGGLAFLGEERGERVSHKRASELAGTGAEIVGAACPFCNSMFQDAFGAISKAPPQLLDIAQIAAASIDQDGLISTPAPSGATVQ